MSSTEAKSEYDQQAEAFLTKYGVSFAVTYIGPDCPPFCEKSEYGKGKLPCGGIHGGKYEITLTRTGKQLQGGKLQFHFWNSYADEYQPGDNAWLKVNNLKPSHMNRLIAEDWTKQPLAKRRLKTRCMETLGATWVGKEVLAKPPTAYDVLAVISGDCYCPDTFEEWCSEYGYDTDSRKAEAQYRICKDFAYKLVRFFTSDEIEALQEIR